MEKFIVKLFIDEKREKKVSVLLKIIDKKKKKKCPFNAFLKYIFNQIETKLKMIEKVSFNSCEKVVRRRRTACLNCMWWDNMYVIK